MGSVHHFLVSGIDLSTITTMPQNPRSIFSVYSDLFLAFTGQESHPSGASRAFFSAHGSAHGRSSPLDPRFFGNTPPGAEQPHDLRSLGPAVRLPNLRSFRGGRLRTSASGPRIFTLPPPATVVVPHALAAPGLPPGRCGGRRSSPAILQKLVLSLHIGDPVVSYILTETAKRLTMR